MTNRSGESSKCLLYIVFAPKATGVTSSSSILPVFSEESEKNLGSTTSGVNTSCIVPRKHAGIHLPV
ncbi:hypothetical protein Pan181_43130 [Aeoliella mucimassa]|uniref:Uncharacterized protein n=1 Tax=Aeoliella mucimassa TaxID=2527972 RepID=A0A518ATQ2_9BACT|nr:hypothetical protein Pan181_43130 [Aeoliella mucimassa]